MEKETVKIIKQTFLSSLKRGTGEAYLLAMKYPEIDFSESIIRCSIKNHAYDRQCESSRASYLFKIIKLSKKQEKIKCAILKGLLTEKEDTWSLTQLFDLAKMYARQGDQDAKKAIYKRYCHETIEGSEWCGYDAIIELDGLDGLKFLAERTGEWLTKHNVEWQDDMILISFENTYPKINAWKELKRYSKRNTYINTYLNLIKKTKDNWKKQKRTPLLVHDNAIDEILNNPHTFLVLRKMKVSKADLLAIARRLEIEKNIAKKERLLAVFTKYKFPFDYKKILTIAQKREMPNQRIVEFAIGSLKHLKNNDIRNFALERIFKTRNPSMYANILISNYKNGDEKILSQLADKYNNLDIVEDLACSFIEIYNQNKTKKCKKPLEIIYNKMNCGIHRNSIVETLLTSGVLSEKIRKEITYDSNEETQRLSRKTKKVNNK